MIRSLSRRGFEAFVAAIEWVVIAIDDRVRDAFGPGARVRRFHGGVSRLVNRYADNSLYFEYDAWRNTYVVGVEHYKTDPDDYELGHTAGKLASVLGALPCVVALIAIEAFGFVAPWLPGHWIVGLAVMAVAIYIALFAYSAAYHWLFLSVEMQDLDREVSEP